MNNGFVTFFFYIIAADIIDDAEIAKEFLSNEPLEEKKNSRGKIFNLCKTVYFLIFSV